MLRLSSIKPIRCLFCLLGLLLLLTSCDTKDTLFTIPDVSIDIDISNRTVWSKARRYIIEKSDFTVQSGLIIQEGTVVVVKQGCSITVSDTGYISAQGSDSKPIIFTSQFDTQHGNTPDASRAVPGSWNNIIIKGSNKSIFNICQFYYGGGGMQPSTLQVTAGSVITLNQCLFVNNKGGNLSQLCGVVNASEASSTSIISNCQFYSNELPVSINPNMSIDNSNTFKNQEKTLSNKYNSILISTLASVSQSVSWKANNVAFVIEGSQLIITSTAKVFIGDSSVFKFNRNSELHIIADTTSIFNSAGPGVHFTSIFDDNYKGDTNNDGTATSPQAGDWVGITNSNNVNYQWKNIFYARK